MEREGFKHCMENINEKGRKIMVVATDHHVGIREEELERLYLFIEDST